MAAGPATAFPDLVALRAALAATWPPLEVRRVGPFTLRRDDSDSNRTSAATLDAVPGQLDADIAATEAAMRAWGRAPLFQLWPGDATLDAALGARGYAVKDATLLLGAPVAAFEPPGGHVIPCDAPLARQREIWAAGGIAPARLAVMARVAVPHAYLLGRLGDRPAATGFVAVHGGIAMLHAVEVAAFARRHGLGGRMVAGAAAWAARAAGVTTLALVVTRTNAPACALYARAGLAEAGSYHYRLAPQT